MIRAMATRLSRYLALIVAAVAVPAAAFAVAAAANLYDPSAANALFLSMSGLALLLGTAAALLLARDLERVLRDVAMNARMLANGLPLSLIAPPLAEVAAIANALAGAARMRTLPEPHAAPVPAPIVSDQARPFAAVDSFSVAPFLEDALVDLRDRSAAAGCSVAADLHHAKGWIGGDGKPFQRALSCLVARTLRLAPRGGTVTLSAARDGDEIGIALRWQAAAGMRLAAAMVELRCGVDAVQRLAEARADIQSLSGTLETAQDAAGETVLIRLPLERARRAA